MVVFLNNPDQWKQQVYDKRYNQQIVQHVPEKKVLNKEVDTKPNTESAISWYAIGLKNPEAFTAACWQEYPKGTRFRVTFNGNSVIVTCTDRGNFKQMGRMLDLSSGAFRQLSPLSRGIIRGAVVEVIK